MVRIQSRRRKESRDRIGRKRRAAAKGKDGTEVRTTSADTSADLTSHRPGKAFTCRLNDRSRQTLVGLDSASIAGAVQDF